MISQMIDTIKILEENGFTKDQAIQMILTNEIKFLGERLNEFSSCN